MNARLLLGLLTILCCSCSTFRAKREAAAIEKAVQQDREAHTAIFRGKDTARLPPLSAPNLVNEYAARLRNIDMSKTPTEFRVAYLEHIQAWEGLAVEMKRKPEPLDLILLLKTAGLVAAHAHPLALAATVLESTAEKKPAGGSRTGAKEDAARAIRETWNKVELIAVEHNANIRPQ